MRNFAKTIVAQTNWYLKVIIEFFFVKGRALKIYDLQGFKNQFVRIAPPLKYGGSAPPWKTGGAK